MARLGVLHPKTGYEMTKMKLITSHVHTRVTAQPGVEY